MHHKDEVRRFLSDQKSLRLFRQVLSRYYNAPFDHDDMVQDIAVRCIEQAKHFRGGSVEAWASVVARRAILNELRKPDYRRLGCLYEETRDERLSFDDPEAVTEAQDLAESFLGSLTNEEYELCMGLVEHEGSCASLARKSPTNKNTLHSRKRRLALRYASLATPS